MTLEGYEGELDIFYGGVGNDGSDVEEGFFSNNTRQYGGDENDSFIGGGGRDYLFGEAGDDFLTTAVFLNDNIADFIDGGDGFDTYSPATTRSWAVRGTETASSAGSATTH